MIGAAILAAGGSRRLGRPTQLLPCRGTTLIRAVANEVCAARFDRAAVVVGANAGEVAAAVAGLPLAVEANWLWPEGMSASVRTATAWAIRSRCDALGLIACDQPRLTFEHLDRLVAMFERMSDPVAVASAYGGVLGVPAVFGARAFERLFRLAGDRGASAMLEGPGVGVVDWPDGAVDVDVEMDVKHCG